MKTAVIGSGLIGRSWAIVFARGGHEVMLWDQDPAQVDRALAVIAQTLPDMADAGLLRDADAIRARIKPAATLPQALEGGGFVQESIAERPEPKQDLFAAIEKHVAADAVLASSTSAIMPSVIFGGLSSRQRCLVAHPMNPPHLAPVIELCGAGFTSPETLARAASFMAGCGMKPVAVNREIEGFVLNRLQFAVMNEALRLVAQGYVSPEDLDTTIKDGLALRWSFMGPIETTDLNAPGGIADALARYGGAFRRVGEQQAASPPWPDSVAEILDAWRRAHVPRDKIAEASQWRDRRLMALAVHKREQDKENPR
jgi:3-hydroxyacyl-CoA dehydrogenase